MCTAYLVIVITVLFFTYRAPISERFAQADIIRFKPLPFLSSMSSIVFAYMYQPNIPIIYRELARPSYKRMDKVIIRGSFFVIFLYMAAATFGYLSWAGTDQINTVISKGIIYVNYEGNIAFTIAVCTLLVTLCCAGPLCVLPVKDSVEEVLFPQTGMGKKQNVIVTIVIMLFNLVIANVIPSVGTAIDLLGCTTNPLIGFILPILFFLKLCPHETKAKRYTSIALLIFISVVSVIALILTILKLANVIDDEATN